MEENPKSNNIWDALMFIALLVFVLLLCNGTAILEFFR